MRAMRCPSKNVKLRVREIQHADNTHTIRVADVRRASIQGWANRPRVSYRAGSRNELQLLRTKCPLAKTKASATSQGNGEDEAPFPLALERRMYIIRPNRISRCWSVVTAEYRLSSDDLAVIESHQKLRIQPYDVRFGISLTSCMTLEQYVDGRTGNAWLELNC